LNFKLIILRLALSFKNKKIFPLKEIYLTKIFKEGFANEQGEIHDEQLNVYSQKC
jgi:hypothetical protein